ncbi:hypothetical protein FOL46_003744 [Perkinsus olseni]|uniref:Structural maintenance of chromosomes protein n=1 Tax=Perkinsus olseni TaxID=32597 RepID=A0A7J6M1G2_PEROL|nr:hypothetical protein FOL46_003744 [Perkinsus olseni]
MHLKKLTIKGYKTYRDLTTIVDLHAGVNVFVGLNGSGKSNIYSAVRFVLGGERIASEQQRRSLLHQSHGRQASSAYVELTLNNADGRIPIDKAEVTLRRTITLKTDVYHWDGKQATKSEVNSWLEAAGVSTKSRTYYVVEQGKVTSLALISDAKRLDLLKEVSGTRVYDLRREESLAVIEKTKKKREQTSEIIEEIREKLDQLDRDRTELREFEHTVREKTALEIVIADRERKQCGERIKELENEAKEVQREFAEESAVLADMTRELEEEKAKLDTVNEEVKGYSSRGSIMNQRFALVEKLSLVSVLSKDRNGLSIEHAELSAGYQMREGGEIASYGEVDGLRSELETTRREAECLTEELEHEREALAVNEGRLRELHADVDELNRSREKFVIRDGPKSATFSQPEDTLTHKLEVRERRYEEVREIAKQQKHNVDAQENEYSIIVRKIEEKEAESEVVNENSARLKREVEDVSAEILGVSERLRQTNRVLSSVGKNLTELRKEKQDLLDTFWQASPPGTREGYAAIMEANLPGVHGLLLEHISVPEEYRLAVEVTAGPQLFNILVDDGEVMGRCMDLLKRKQAESGKSFRATFMSLEEAKERDSSQNPPGSVADSLPLADVIESPDWVRCVVQRVWERFILVTGATEGPAGHEFSTVTREGDIFSRNGLLEGGFFDSRRCTRLEEWERVSRVKHEVKLLEDRLENVTANLLTERSAEKNLKRRLLSIRVNLQRNLRAEAVKGRQLSELRDARQRSSDSIYLAARLSREYDAEQKSLELEIAAIEAERKSPVTDTGELTEADGVQLENLVEELAKKRQEVSENSQKVAERRAAIGKLRSRLTLLIDGRLSPLEEQLRAAILATTEEQQDDLEKERSIRWLAGELTEIEQELALASERLSELRELQSSKSSCVEGMEAEAADLEASVASLKGAYDEKTNEIKVYEERRALADTKLDDIIAHQPDVDNLDDVIREMTDDTPQLRKRLLKCAKAVSRFASVNNKAAEQFGEFNGQYEDLLQKQREMDEGQAAIDDLIRSLDAEKKDNIVKSFAQINENFSETFSALVPDGSAKMKLLRRGHSEEDGEDSDDTTSSMTDEEYVGVALEVTFSRSRSRMKRMYELSGGQKTVVAVALLFAMQKTEQPPFYLFDEIDAALDPQYREAVARLVASVANPESGAPAQVICTTFHSELCQVADRHYRVSINDCSSSVAFSLLKQVLFLRVSASGFAANVRLLLLTWLCCGERICADFQKRFNRISSPTRFLHQLNVMGETDTYVELDYRSTKTKEERKEGTTRNR